MIKSGSKYFGEVERLGDKNRIEHTDRSISLPAGSKKVTVFLNCGRTEHLGILATKILASKLASKKSVPLLRR